MLARIMMLISNMAVYAAIELWIVNIQGAALCLGMMGAEHVEADCERSYG